jgi:hypothetical protein
MESRRVIGLALKLNYGQPIAVGAACLAFWGGSLPIFFAMREAAFGPQQRCRPAAAAAGFWGTAAQQML